MVWLSAKDLLNFHCNVAWWKWLMKWEILYTNDLLVMKTICHLNNLNFISADDTLFRKDVRDHVHDQSNTSPSTEVNEFHMIPFIDRIIFNFSLIILWTQISKQYMKCMRENQSWQKRESTIYCHNWEEEQNNCCSHSCCHLHLALPVI